MNEVRTSLIFWFKLIYKQNTPVSGRFLEQKWNNHAFLWKKRRITKIFIDLTQRWLSRSYISSHALVRVVRLAMVLACLELRARGWWETQHSGCSSPDKANRRLLSDSRSVLSTPRLAGASRASRARSARPTGPKVRWDSQTEHTFALQLKTN